MLVSSSATDPFNRIAFGATAAPATTESTLSSAEVAKAVIAVSADAAGQTAISNRISSIVDAAELRAKIESLASMGEAAEAYAVENPGYTTVKVVGEEYGDREEYYDEIVATMTKSAKTGDSVAQAFVEAVADGTLTVTNLRAYGAYCIATSYLQIDDDGTVGGSSTYYAYYNLDEFYETNVVTIDGQTYDKTTGKYCMVGQNGTDLTYWLW